ncbi:molybdenum cofactor guanylyltransferase MobA [Aurantivibrio plasticivorans]
MSKNHDTVFGIVLAGGMSERMQSLDASQQPIDKCLLEWQNKPLIAHVIHQASAQVAEVIVSSNSSDKKYRQLNTTLLADDGDIKQCGPLAGILTALRWAKKQQLPYHWLATFPGDTPTLPSDIVSRLIAAQDNDNRIKVISLQTGERRQPLFSLWSRDCLQPLNDYLSKDKRKVMQFIEELPHHYVVVNEKEYTLNNINTPEDWETLNSDTPPF